MHKTVKYAGIALAVATAIINANELDFDKVEVSANEISNTQKPFATTGAVSHREISSSDTQSIDSIVRGVSGAYTQIDQSQGTVSVNIRGMSGLGRVNTMIDGVTQTFFGTSADHGGYHQGGTTNAFGAMIDQNFLVGVDINRGIADANALMGSANFRTIGVDDVVREGNIFGFLGKYSYGTNGIGPNYMATIGAKTKINNDEGSIGAIFGYSGKKTTQDYKSGDGSKTTDTRISEYDSDETIAPAYGDISRLKQKPHSILFKIQANPNEYHALDLQYRKYSNYLAGRDMDNQTYQVDYKFNPHELLNLKFLAAHTLSRQTYDSSKSVSVQNISDMTGGVNLNQKNTYDTISLENAFNYDITQNLKIKQTIGASYGLNKYTSNVSRQSLSQKGMGSTVFSPSGKQILTNLFFNNVINAYELVKLEANLNKTYYTIKGHKPECGDSNPSCIPKQAMDISKNGNFYNGKAVFSLLLHDLFTPYISYAVTHRAPNVQEVFFGSDAGDSVNPYLRPEKATTKEIGFNSMSQNLFTDNDFFGFKFNYYKTRFKDFIYDRRFDLGSTYFLYVNHDVPINFRGYEIELNYDMGIFYTKISYTRQKTDQIQSETSSSYYGNFNYTQVQDLPKYYGQAEVGARFFDEKLQLGVIAKYTGKAKRAYPSDGSENRDGDNDDINSPIILQDLPKIPTIYDLNLVYKLSKNFTIKGEVQNLFNKNYIDALNANNSTNQLDYNSNGDNIYLFSNSARGRTYYVNFEYRY